MHSQVFTDSRGQVLVMEYAPYGNMTAYVTASDRLPEKLARWFYQQLIVAVDFCRKQVSAPTAGKYSKPGLLRLLSYPRRCSILLCRVCIWLVLQGVVVQDLSLDKMLFTNQVPPVIKLCGLICPQVYTLCMSTGQCRLSTACFSHASAALAGKAGSHALLSC